MNRPRAGKAATRSPKASATSWAVAVLDAAGVDRAHVYGHSMGGRIAQWLGAEHADRVRSLTLGATTVGGSGSVTPSPASLEAMGHHLAAVALHHGPDLNTITVPTPVIHGAEDRLAVPANAALLARGIPDARLVLLPGARHADWVGNPDAHQQVRAFLTEHDPTKA